MKLYLDGHGLSYEMQALCFAFFPGERVICEEKHDKTPPPFTDKNADISEKPTVRGETETDGDFVFTRLKCHAGGKVSALVAVSRGGKTVVQGERVLASQNDADYRKQCECALGRAIYRAASCITGIKPPWGILTGIRPVKLVRSRLAAGMSPEEVVSDFSRQFYTNEKKTRLCLETSVIEQRIISLSRPDSVSLYISVPFCPSRCLYCSFISHDVEKSAKLLPDYVTLLCEELKHTGELLDELGLRLETIYVGGGTPTVLSARQLESVLTAVKKSFKLDKLREYTVEAGRPDTITRDKLEAILEGGASRISINPQTLDDVVLRRIGRNHTAEDVFSAFALAKDVGVPCINMDLIAGLPGDTPEGFRKTLKGVIGLAPEAVTVHTLAMKRSSRLVTLDGGLYDAAGISANIMLHNAVDFLGAAGYAPYYLYRQKNTLGGLENIGFSKPGFEGLYNVFIMDETHTILAAGAGGVTKMRQPNGGLIERVFNFKYPYEYISRFGEIISRKKKVKEFYANFPKDNGQS
jgi:oxygen-independent coproporphyrinogen-3 oxidase